MGHSRITTSPAAVAGDDGTDALIAAALAEFAAAGYASVTVAGIARRAGMTPDALQRAFASKEELFREVVRSTLVAVPHQADLAAACAPQASTADQVRDFARRYLRLMERPELTAVLLLTLGELPRFPELAVFHATETLERFLRELEQLIERGIARGELRALDVRATARTMLATLAAHALWFAHPEVYAGVVGPDHERAAEATIETLVRTLGA